MKLDKTIQKVQDQLESLSETLQQPLQGITAFVRKHKKLIVSLAVIYVVYNFLFSEEE